MCIFQATMTIAEFLLQAKKKLKNISESADLDAEILLSEVLQKPRSFLFARPEYLLSTKQKQKAGIFLQQRVMGNPIAYIVGEKEFFGMNFEVNQHTLVPRPETEILVEKACELLKNGGTLLDIGTGSGCIPVSIAKNSTVENIYACDICENAIQTAKKNAKTHGVKIDFCVSDLLKNIPKSIFLEAKKPLIITANLPYVPENEKHPSVQKEPETAIYSGEDGLNHYRNLFSQLANISFDALIIEFHPPQTEELKKMQKEFFPQYHTEIIQDYSEQDRIACINK